MKRPKFWSETQMALEVESSVNRDQIRDLQHYASYLEDELHDADKLILMHKTEIKQAREAFTKLVNESAQKLMVLKTKVK